MKIDHVGYAVKSIEKAKKGFLKLGFEFSEVIPDDDRGIDICFGESDGYRIELVAPAREGSPVDTYLKSVGPTPYHFCYKTTDLEAEIARLEGERFKVIIPPHPAVAFDGRNVVFMKNLGVGMIEIVEEPE